MKHAVKNHFQLHDHLLYSVLKKIADFELTYSHNYFAHLCDSIISQQLSEKVGTVLYERFKLLFLDTDITPLHLLALSDETIRTIGTSRNKVVFMKDLAQKVLDKTINLEKINLKTNEEIMQELTQVKGIGPWTVEMFLMSGLAREDIFSLGDLGLKRAIQKLYSFSEEPTKIQMLEISQRWKPYRSYASRILWQSLSL